jgi:hypothetical protein
MFAELKSSITFVSTNQKNKMNQQIINFLQTKGQFQVTSTHSSIESVVEAQMIINLVSKKDNFKVLKSDNNFFFSRNGNVIADQMATFSNGIFTIKSLTSQSLSQLENEL